MTTGPERTRVVWTSMMLIGNICKRESYSVDAVNQLFITHGADERWFVEAGFPDINAGKAMRQVHGWFTGIERYAPDSTLSIAYAILIDLASSSSIVAHQEKIAARSVIGRIQLLSGMPSSTQASQQQDQRVTDAAGSLFASRHYSSAVQRSYVALVNAVKDKADCPSRDGRDLMFHAFRATDPILRLSDEQAVQEGYMYLFAGAVGAIRNPASHTAAETLTAEEAVEMLTYCSLLFRFLDRSQKVR